MSISGDTCSAFFVLIVLKTCGSIETAVSTPAATPIIKIMLFDSCINNYKEKLCRMITIYWFCCYFDVMFSLKNKHAVITGGGSGIGRAVCLLFAKQEAFVHIVDINETGANETASQIKNEGGKVQVHICDVSNQQQTVEVFNSINKIDILVNSAGISHIGKAHTTSEEDFDRIFRVNVKGIYNCFLPLFHLCKKIKVA